MKRNSITLFLESPGAITPVPWVDDAPDFSGFSEPTLGVLQSSWQAFLDSGEELEVIPDPPPPIPEPDWDALRLGLIASTAITNWFESVPTLLQNDIAAQIQAQQLDKLLQGLNLTDYSTVKDELNQLLADCNFDLVLT